MTGVAVGVNVAQDERVNKRRVSKRTHSLCGDRSCGASHANNADGVGG